MRDRRTGADRAADFRREARLRALLRRDLQGALYTGGTLASRFSGAAATASAPAGETAVLEFTTTAERPAADGLGGDVTLVAYRLAADGSLRRAVRRDLLATVWDDIEGIAVAEGVDDVEPQFHDGTDWRNDWDAEEQGGLPVAVAVRIRWSETGPGAARPPFEITVPLNGGPAGDGES